MKAVDEVHDNVVLSIKLYVYKREANKEGMYRAIRRHPEIFMERHRIDHVELHYIHRVDREEPEENVARPWAGLSTRA